MRRSTTTAGAIATGMAILFGSAAALGHAELHNPPPRDDAGCNNTVQACKTEPCGGKSKGNIRATWKANGNVNITFAETVNHTGCFVLEISPTGNDNDFIPYRVIPDNTNPKEQTKAITLDGGVSCANCTLRLRQIMGADPATCNATTTGTAGTYYQCSDVMILLPDGGTPPSKTTTGTDAGKTQTTDSGSSSTGDGSSSDDGPSGSDSDAGSDGEEATPKDDAGGCSTIPGELPYGGAIGLGLMGGLAVLARRRKRK